MSIRFEHPVLTKIRQEGGVDVLQEIADAGRKTYCSLYSNNPGWIFVKENFTLPIIKRWSDDMCQDFPPPPPSPPPPFFGGQCCDANYKVVVNITRQFYDNPPTTYNSEFLSVAGKINQVYLGSPPDNPNFLNVYVLFEDCDGSIEQNGNPVGGAGFTGKINDVTITRNDGLPDDCGNPDVPPFPVLPPPLPPDLTRTVEIINNAGDIYNYNVTIDTQDDGYIPFPLILNISGAEVVIDVGGISINNGGGGGEGEPELFEEQQEESPGKEPTIEIRTNDRGEKINGHIATATNLKSVLIIREQKPKNDDVSAGLGSPDVRYYGWFMWRTGSGSHPRQFLHFDRQFFPAPSGVTGYSAFYKEGYSARIVETTETVTVPQEETTQE